MRKYEVGNTYRFIRLINVDSNELTETADSNISPLGPVHEPIQNERTRHQWLFPLESVQVLELRCFKHALLELEIAGKVRECQTFVFKAYDGTHWSITCPDPLGIMEDAQAAYTTTAHGKEQPDDPFVDYDAFFNHLHEIMKGRDASLKEHTAPFLGFLTATVDYKALEPGFRMATTSWERNFFK